MLFIDERLAQCLGRARKDGAPRPYARLSSPPRGYQFFITIVVSVSRSNPTGRCLDEGGGNIAGQIRAAIRSATEPTVGDPIGARFALGLADQESLAVVSTRDGGVYPTERWRILPRSY